MSVRREGGLWIHEPSGDRWEAVIGLEVHAQLATRTKLFCGCEVAFGAPPNARTCPVCTGQPGALPVLNAEALDLAVRVALAVDAEVDVESRFDRKHYFYCDLPKNFQVSQYARPFCTGGGVELEDGARVRLARIHLEEDAGKAIHDRGDVTLVDLNRAGVPLIESVTEADLRSPEQAYEYLSRLKEILQYVGASSADMEKGELRCDVNVSVRPPGAALRTKVEVKNLNSFRHVQAALEHEIERQIEAYAGGDPARAPIQETRLFDPASGATRTMRVKEGEADYRYFPDPDLPPVTCTPARREELRALLPELPAARRRRYVAELGLSEYDAGVLTAVRAVADFFEATARLSGRAKESANWIANDLLGALADPDVAAGSVDELTLRPFDLAELIGLVAEGAVNTAGARRALREMLQSGRGAKEVVQALGLEQVDDEARLEAWCRAALAGRDAIVADVRAGKEKAVGALIGPVMQASKGAANPQKVREILLRLIAAG